MMKCTSNIDFSEVLVSTYLDDILIFSKTYEEHIVYVNTVLAQLYNAGLQLDIKKSKFCVQHIKYLGFILTTKGLEIDPNKLEILHS